MPERLSARNVTARAANAGANAPSNIKAPPNGEPAGIGTKATAKKQIHISANASAKNTKSVLADETRTVGSRDSASCKQPQMRERRNGQGDNYATPQRQRRLRSQRLVNASDFSSARLHRNAKWGRIFRARLMIRLKVAAGGAAKAVGLVPMGFLSCANGNFFEIGVR